MGAKDRDKELYFDNLDKGLQSIHKSNQKSQDQETEVYSKDVYGFGKAA